MDLERRLSKRPRLARALEVHRIGKCSLKATGPELINEAISIYLIAKEVFRHLSLQDLLNCCLVNKSWNSSARFTLREDRRTFAYLGLKSELLPCDEVKDLHNTVSRAWSLPFNGLSFGVPEVKRGHFGQHVVTCIQENQAQVTILYRHILSKIKIKYLRISWADMPKRFCPSFRLISHIMKDPQLCQTLQELIIDQLPRLQSTIKFSRYFNRCSCKADDGPLFFPNLRVLQLPEALHLWGSGFSPQLTITELLQATPQLRSVKGYVPLGFLPRFVSLKKTWTLDEFYFEIIENTTDPEHAIPIKEYYSDGKNYNAHSFLNFAVKFTQKEGNDVKFRKLLIRTQSIIDSYIEFPEQPDAIEEAELLRLKSRAVCTRILRQSSESIQELCVDYMDLYSIVLKLFALPPPKKLQLNRLVHLTLYSPCLGLALQALRPLSFYKLESNCPSLQSIEITPHGGLFTQMETTDYLKLADYDRGSQTVQKLKITDHFEGESVMTEIFCLAVLFPNVKHFTADLKYCEDMTKCLEALWTAWPRLETLQLDNIRWSVAVDNWDPLFTGLSHDDNDNGPIAPPLPWAYWSDAILKKHQAAPSLRNLRMLRRLQINMAPHHCDSRILRDAKEFLSELTGWLVFRRMPQLKVHISRECCLARHHRTRARKCDLKLKHLQTFVEFDRV